MSGEEMRARLAEALRALYGAQRGGAYSDDPGEWRRDADSLLPVVRAIVAEELRAAGDAHPCTKGRLHERADALEAGS